MHIYPCTITHDFLHYFVYLTSFDNNRNHSLIEIHASANETKLQALMTLRAVDLQDYLSHSHANWAN